MDRYVENGIEYIKLEGECLDIVKEFYTLANEKHEKIRELMREVGYIKAEILEERLRAISKVALLLGIDPTLSQTYDIFSGYIKMDIAIFLRYVSEDDSEKERVIN